MAQPRSLPSLRNPSLDYMGLQTVPAVTILQAENENNRSWRSQLSNLYKTPAEDHVTATEQVLSSIQAVLAGGALGLVDAYNGGLDVKGIPVDATVAAVLGVAAVAYDSRATARLADSCNTIYGFRKVKAVLGLIGAKMMGGSENSQQEVSSVAGEVTERTPVPPGKDPIVAIGESL